MLKLNMTGKTRPRSFKEGTESPALPLPFLKEGDFFSTFGLSKQNQMKQSIGKGKANIESDEQVSGRLGT